MKNFYIIIAIAVLLEALVEYAKSIVKMFTEGDRKTATMQLITIIAGIAFGFLFKLQLFHALEIAVDVTADKVLTGIIISRGSNYANDLISKIRGELHDQPFDDSSEETLESIDVVEYPDDER